MSAPTSCQPPATAASGEGRSRLASSSSSEEQQRKIEEVRGLLGSHVVKEMGSFLSESTVRRFLGGRNWSVPHAAKALREAVTWRRRYRPDAIRWEDIADKEQEWRKIYIADYLDKDGRSILVAKTATKSKVSEKEQIKHLVYLLEQLATSSEEDCVVWLTDFHGWSISCTPLSLTRASLFILQNYYPGLIHMAIAFNPPRMFESFWKIAKHFIEPKMANRVKFVYDNNAESQRMVADMFDMEKLDSSFGGRSTAVLDMDTYANTMRRRDHTRVARVTMNM